MSQALFLFNISAVQTMSTGVPLVNAVTQTTTDDVHDDVHDDSMQEDERSSDEDDMSVDSDESQYVPSDEENMMRCRWIATIRSMFPLMMRT